VILRRGDRQITATGKCRDQRHGLTKALPNLRGSKHGEKAPKASIHKRQHHRLPRAVGRCFPDNGTGQVYRRTITQNKSPMPYPALDTRTEAVGLERSLDVATMRWQALVGQPQNFLTNPGQIDGPRDNRQYSARPSRRIQHSLCHLPDTTRSHVAWTSQPQTSI
jgi:hypothetical protein